MTVARLAAAGLASLLLSAALSLLTRWVALRVGAVARPRADRWHKKQTALFGGVALAASTVGCLLAFGPASMAASSRLVMLIGLSSLMFLLGFVDDIARLQPQSKLIAQILAAAALVYFGFRLPTTGIGPIDGLLTIFWVVGITNAINLLDNMDGLAAGTTGISAIVMAVFLFSQGDIGPAVAAATLAGACVGFLLFNFNPASIFMGDCGSMFLGFFVSGLALLSSYGRSRNLLATLAVPVLVLLVPIFDTTFVTLVRKTSGRPISQGGRDHTSHRLVALGLSERRAVLTLWSLSALSGGLAIWVRLGGAATPLAIAVPLIVTVMFVGTYLARERLDAGETPSERRPGYVTFLADLAHKRRVFEVLLDVVLVVFAYCAAHLLRYDGHFPIEVRAHIVEKLPLLVAVQIGAFAASGLYRGVWRYTGVEDLIRITRAAGLAAGAYALVGAFLYRLMNFSRSALVLDGILLLLLVGGSRVSFRVLRTLLQRRPSQSKKTLIFGAGDSGELLLREIRNNDDLGLQPVGFVDDDERLRGRIIHDLQILGGMADIPALVRSHGISTIVLSNQAHRECVEELLSSTCVDLPVEIRRLRIELAER